MRTERLLRLILELSDGRRRTAATLATRLDVSERTVLRDIETLAGAGVPVEASRGPEGGITLPRSWARQVSGLTTPEVAALAALRVPSADSALQKVLLSLPAIQREQAELARQRLLVDPTPWWGDAPRPLDLLRDAVWADRVVELGYRGRQRRVSPLAIVIKAGSWYLLGDTEAGRRTFRGDRIEGVTVMDARFERDPDFDLRRAWEEAEATFTTSRPHYWVKLSLTDAGRTQLLTMRPAAEASRIAEEPAEVDFQQETIALSQLVLLGAEARVLAPKTLVARMRAIGAAWAGRSRRDRKPSTPEG